jgi:stearoyl-CoA 9-desaturase NADPH oxidoreductase
LIFAAELQALAQQHPALTLHLHFSASHGRFDIDALVKHVPEFRSYHTFLCGPGTFATGFTQALRARGAHLPIASEHFGGITHLQGTDADLGAHTVALRRPGAPSMGANQTFTAAAQATLLDAMEFAGLTPNFGCRIGICKSCQCMKRAGTVQNTRTGEVSDAPNEWIQLCISRAQSPLELSI